MMKNILDSNEYDEEIEEWKIEYNYYNLLEKWGDENIHLYKTKAIKERLRFMGIDSLKFSDDEYLRKISPIAYVEYIYENFQKSTKGKYKKCEILHLPIFNLNGLATITKKDTPIIILDFFLSSTLRLMCYSFITHLFVINEEFIYNKDFPSAVDVYKKNIMPTGFSFIKYFIKQSPEYLAEGLNNVTPFSKENWRIFNNSMLLANAMILFLICHEQAHHELGHTTYNHKIAGIKLSQNIELAADRLALSMFMDCIDPKSEFGLFNNLDSFYLAPFYLFEMFHSIEWLMGRKEDSSHPRAKKRYMNILQSFDYSKYKKDIPIEDIETWYDYFQSLLKLTQ